MFVLARAVTYAALFIAFVLVFLPARILASSGIAGPTTIGIAQVLGGVLTVAGGALAVACAFTFAVIGRGTPAPFDPPRRLVDRGPYGWIRNPMYVGATVALLGAAIFYWSWALGAFALGFLAVTAAFVWLVEEPVLRRMFGAHYDAYCSRVGRWWPRRRPPAVPSN